MDGTGLVQFHVIQNSTKVITNNMTSLLSKLGLVT